MHSRTAAGTTAAAVEAAAAAIAARDFEAQQAGQPDVGHDRAANLAVPGVSYLNFRRRTVHVPGQAEDGDVEGLQAAANSAGLQPRAASSCGVSMACGIPSYAGSVICSPHSRLAVSSNSPRWDLASNAGTAISSMGMAAASIVANPSLAGCATPTTCSTPVSPKRHNRPKWLSNMLKYASPKGKGRRSSKQEAQQQLEQGNQMQLQQQPQEQQQEYQDQLLQEDEQLQAQLQEHEERAFMEQFYEQGWDQLPDHLQHELREQFHEEFTQQLHQQQQLLELQAAFPDLDPAMLQEQFQMYLQALEQGQQGEHGAADEAAVLQQHIQYEQLQQQLATVELPEHVQSLIQQHQQQVDLADRQLMQPQDFAYAVHAASSPEGGQGPVVHVLDGPGGQVVQVTQDEFQDILTVMQALAGGWQLISCII